jgi:hypothetical protein
MASGEGMLKLVFVYPFAKWTSDVNNWFIKGTKYFTFHLIIRSQINPFFSANQLGIL